MIVEADAFFLVSSSSDEASVDSQTFSVTVNIIIKLLNGKEIYCLIPPEI